MALRERFVYAIDVVTDGVETGLNRITSEIKNAEGFIGKLKAGWAGAMTEFKNSRTAQAAAIGGVAMVAKASIDAASNLEESINAVNVSYGDAAESVAALGDDSATSFGMSKRAFNEFAVQFAAFANGIAQSSGREVSAVVEEMTTRIADFASVMNLDVAEAARVFQSALAGETEPVRKFGIDLSAAAVSAHAVEKGMVNSAKEMTEAVKVQARYSLLMQSTSKFQGDFANTSDGLANATRIATANFEDMQATLGRTLIPVVATAVDQLNQLAESAEYVKQAFDILPDPVEKAASKIALYPAAVAKAIEWQVKLPISAAKTIGGWFGIGKSADEATEATLGWAEAAAKAAAAAAVQQEAGEKTNANLRNQADAAFGFLEVLGDLESGLREKAEAFVEAQELEREAMEAGAEAAEEYRDRIDSSFQDAAKSAMSFSDEAKSSLDAYKAELAKSTVETQAFFGHLVAIGRQTSPEFVEHLASMGVGALDMVAEMRATEGGVQEAFDLWSQAAEVAGRDLSAELGAAGTAGSKAFRAALGNEHKAAVGLAFKNGKELGQQQMTGFAAGIDAEKAYAIAKARAAAQEINNAMRAALGVPKGAV